MVVVGCDALCTFSKVFNWLIIGYISLPRIIMNTQLLLKLYFSFSLSARKQNGPLSWVWTSSISTVQFCSSGFPRSLVRPLKLSKTSTGSVWNMYPPLLVTQRTRSRVTYSSSILKLHGITTHERGNAVILGITSAPYWKWAKNTI